jgi:hypothetical protein
MKNQMEVPSEFICPITMEMMVHPIATRYGQNFERSAIFKWLFEGSGECSCCPLTRKPLNMSDLIPNHKLAAKIQKWCENNGIPSGRINDTDDGKEDAYENGEPQLLTLGNIMSTTPKTSSPVSLPLLCPSQPVNPQQNHGQQRHAVISTTTSASTSPRRHGRQRNLFWSLPMMLVEI